MAYVTVAAPADHEDVLANRHSVSSGAAAVFSIGKKFHETVAREISPFRSDQTGLFEYGEWESIHVGRKPDYERLRGGEPTTTGRRQDERKF